MAGTDHFPTTHQTWILDRIAEGSGGAPTLRVHLMERYREPLLAYARGSTLRQLAEQVREELLSDSRITVADLDGVRRPEISIEIPQENLRRYNLTLEQVASAVRLASVDVSGGSVKTTWK